MNRIIVILLCGVMALSGCDSNKSGGKKTAYAASKANSSSSPEVQKASILNKVLANNSITNFLSDKTLLYINLPELADITTVISNSPLKSFWNVPVLQKTFSETLGRKCWQLLKQEAEKASSGQLRGNIELAFGVEPSSTHNNSPKFYLLWKTGKQTTTINKNLTDFLIALEANVPDLTLKKDVIGNIKVLVLSYKAKQEMQLYFGARNGSILISTDTTFFKPWKKRMKHSLRNLPLFQDTLAKVTAKGDSLSFMYANIKQITGLITEQLPISSKILKKIEKTGLSGLQSIGFSVYRKMEQIRDFLYIKWPEKNRGLFKPFLCTANVKGALAIVPENVKSFGVTGVNFLGIWNDISGFIETEFPQYSIFFKQIKTRAKIVIGNSIPELLKAFGADVINYTLKNKNGLLESVFLLSVRDPELLRQVVINLDNKFNKSGKRLLVESIDAIKIFRLGPPISPIDISFAISDKYFVISKNLDAVQNFIRNRRGHKTPLAGSNEVKEIMKVTDVAGLSYIDIGEQLSYLNELSNYKTNGLKTVSKSFITDELQTTFKKVGIDLGAMWSIAFLEPDGISYEMRSSCGMLFFGISAGPVVAASVIPKIVMEKRKKKEKTIVKLIQKVIQGQYNFKLQYSRYAQNLQELAQEKFINDPNLARGHKSGYLFKLKSNGPNSWIFDVRPLNHVGHYFYCDQTGTIRSEENHPAKYESPVIEN